MNLAISIFLFLLTGNNQLHLATDLKKDKVIGRRHGVLYFPSKNRLANFERYAKLDISKYKYSKVNRGLHVINKWAGPGASSIIIYEVETTLPVDTVFAETDGKHHVKTAFLFHTYIIKAQSQPTLIYLTERNEGLCRYRIGKKEQSLNFEDIPLGIKYPDIDGIIKMVGELK